MEIEIDHQMIGDLTIHVSGEMCRRMLMLTAPVPLSIRLLVEIGVLSALSGAPTATMAQFNALRSGSDIASPGEDEADAGAVVLICSALRIMGVGGNSPAARMISAAKIFEAEMGRPPQSAILNEFLQTLIRYREKLNADP